jgi:hypothetical protein
LFDHFNNRFEVAIGTFQTSGNRGMWVVRHSNLLSSVEDNNDPPRRIGKCAWHWYTWGVFANRCPGHPVQDTNPDEESMGSTPYGNANPMTLIGLALPQDIEIGRAGYGRVRVGGRT